MQIPTSGEYHKYIREKCRQVARLLLFIRKETDEDYAMSDLLIPKYFDLLATSVKNFVTENGPGKEKNSLALKLGGSIKQMAQRLRGKCLRNSGSPEADSKQRLSGNFLELFDSEWSHIVSSRCLKRMYDARLNKRQGWNNFSNVIQL